MPTTLASVIESITGQARRQISSVVPVAPAASSASGVAPTRERAGRVRRRRLGVAELLDVTLHLSRGGRVVERWSPLHGAAELSNRSAQRSSGGSWNTTPSGAADCASTATSPPASARRRATTASTSDSGAEAPAVTPTQRARRASHVGLDVVRGLHEVRRHARLARDLDQAVAVRGLRARRPRARGRPRRPCAFTAFWRFCVA